MQGGQHHSRRLEAGRERRGFNEMGGRVGSRFLGVAGYDEDWDDDVYYETATRPAGQGRGGGGVRKGHEGDTGAVSGAGRDGGTRRGPPYEGKPTSGAGDRERTPMKRHYMKVPSIRHRRAMRPASSPKALELFAGVTDAIEGTGTRTGEGPTEATDGNGARPLSRPSGLEPPVFSSEDGNVENKTTDAEDDQAVVSSAMVGSLSPPNASAVTSSASTSTSTSSTSREAGSQNATREDYSAGAPSAAREDLVNLRSSSRSGRLGKRRRSSSPLGVSPAGFHGTGCFPPLGGQAHGLPSSPDDGGGVSVRWATGDGGRDSDGGKRGRAAKSPTVALDRRSSPSSWLKLSGDTGFPPLEKYPRRESPGGDVRRRVKSSSGSPRCSESHEGDAHEPGAPEEAMPPAFHRPGMHGNQPLQDEGERRRRRGRRQTEAEGERDGSSQASSLGPASSSSSSSSGGGNRGGRGGGTSSREAGSSGLDGAGLDRPARWLAKQRDGLSAASPRPGSASRNQREASRDREGGRSGGRGSRSREVRTFFQPSSMFRAVGGEPAFPRGSRRISHGGGGSLAGGRWAKSPRGLRLPYDRFKSASGTPTFDPSRMKSRHAVLEATEDIEDAGSEEYGDDDVGIRARSIVPEVENSGGEEVRLKREDDDKDPRSWKAYEGGDQGYRRICADEVGDPGNISPSPMATYAHGQTAREISAGLDRKDLAVHAGSGSRSEGDLKQTDGLDEEPMAKSPVPRTPKGNPLPEAANAENRGSVSTKVPRDGAGLRGSIPTEDPSGAASPPPHTPVRPRTPSASANPGSGPGSSTHGNATWSSFGPSVSVGKVKGAGRWRPSFGGGDVGSAKSPGKPSPWAAFSTPSRTGGSGVATATGSTVGLSTSARRRKSGGAGNGPLGRLLQKVRARFDGDEARLLSGEFPFRPGGVSGSSASATATGSATGRRDHGDPRTRCGVALDMTVLSSRTTTDDPDDVRLGGGKGGGGHSEQDSEAGVLSRLSCFVHRVVDLAGGDPRRPAAGDAAKALGRLRPLEGRDVRAVFKADTRRALDIVSGSQIRVYDPCWLSRAEDDVVGEGRAATGPLLVCTQLCEPYPQGLPPLVVQAPALPEAGMRTPPPKSSDGHE